MGTTILNIGVYQDLGIIVIKKNKNIKNDFFKSEKCLICHDETKLPNIINIPCNHIITCQDCNKIL